MYIDFLKKSKDKKAYLFGSGEHIRPQEEMAKIDVKEADDAFKLYKKEMFDAFMKAQGFVKWKSQAYVRVNDQGLICYVDLQKERYGSRTFTVNLAVEQLYVPREYFSMGISERLGTMAVGRDFWWDFKDYETAKKSFENVIETLEKFAMPWFCEFNSKETYIAAVKNKKLGFGANLERVVYFYIKENDVESARAYLNECKACVEKENNPINFNRVLLEIDRLSELLTSIVDTKEYINSCVQKNVETFKLPRKMLEGKVI